MERCRQTAGGQRTEGIAILDTCAGIDIPALCFHQIQSEYFLGKFALKEGQGGGEFFTPTSVVRLMVKA